YQEAQKRRAERVGTRITEEKQAITAVPHEAPPAEPTPIPRPPSAGLTPFLAPVEGERPENTIAKLIQGVGLLATGAAGRKEERAMLQKSFDLAAVNHQYAIEMEERKHKHAIEDQERMLSTYRKEDLRSMGQQWFLYGTLPRTYGKAGVLVQAEVIKEGNEWAK